MAASATDVWEAATHWTGVMFMGSKVSTNWHAGHSITLKGKQYKDRGKVATFQRNKLLEFTYYSPLSGKADEPDNYNLVSISLQSTDGGTQVTITQSLAANAEPPDDETLKEFEKNWQAMLENLRSAAEK
jgi:uncharacterized protein YndB with AHSA1/START domain